MIRNLLDIMETAHQEEEDGSVFSRFSYFSQNYCGFALKQSNFAGCLLNPPYTWLFKQTVPGVSKSIN